MNKMTGLIMKFSWTVFLIFIGLANLFAEKSSLLNFVSKEADLVCVAQMQELSEMPVLRNLRQTSPNFNWLISTFEEELKTYGFNAKSMPKEVLYFRGLKKMFTRNQEDLKGLLVKTSIPQKDYFEILQKTVPGNFATLFRKKIMRHGIFIIKKNTEKSFITYIKSDVLLITWKEQDLKTVLKSLTVNVRFKIIKMKKQVNTEGPLWGAFNIPQELRGAFKYINLKNFKSAIISAGGFYDLLRRMHGGIISISPAGENNNDVKFSSIVKCVRRNDGHNLAEKFKKILSVFIMAFDKNRDLAVAVDKAVKSEVDGRILKLNITLTEKLMDEMKNNFRKLKQQHENNSVRKITDEDLQELEKNKKE